MKKVILSALILNTAFAAGAYSQVSTTWRADAATNEWTTPGNWFSGVPDGNSAIIASGTPIISSAVNDVTHLYVGGVSGAPELTIAAGGSLNVTASGGVRVSNSAGQTGVLKVDGGSLTAATLIYVGGTDNNTNGTLILSNGGVANSGPTNHIWLGTSAASVSGQSGTLVFGGLTTAVASGWLNSAGVTGWASVGDNGTVLFNHTSARYTLQRGASNTTAVNLAGNLKVDAKAGVTVLRGNNTYSKGTTVRSGGTLLANNTTAAQSSTGTGAVTVLNGGALGGIGNIAGATTISGTLKPGDYAYGADTASYTALNFGSDLTLLAGSTTEFALNGETRGVDYSAINVAGTLTLGGELEIVLGEDFEIALGETQNFELFRITGGSGDITGDFAFTNMPDVWNGLALNWDATTLSDNGYLTLSAQAIPEPSHVVTLIGFGAAALLLRKRRVANRA